MRSLRILGGIVLIAPLLVGCSADSGDGRSGSGFSSPLKEIQQHLTSGSGDELCTHLNEITPGSCDFIISSSGLGSNVVPLATFSPTGETFLFEVAGFSLSIERTDEQFESGIERFWSVGTFRPEKIVIPLGGSYQGLNLTPGVDYKIMPGALDSQSFELASDRDNLWQAELNEGQVGDEFVSYSLSESSSIAINQLLLEACDSAIETLTISEILANPTAPKFLRAFQTDDAKSLIVGSSSGSDLQTRNLNSPTISGTGECRIELGASSFPAIIASAAFELDLEGDVERYTGMSRFGVSQYEYIPNSFSGELTLDLMIETDSSLTNSVQVGTVKRPAYWVADKPIKKDASL
jgi:hypothetical protein